MKRKDPCTLYLPHLINILQTSVEYTVKSTAFLNRTRNVTKSNKCHLTNSNKSKECIQYFKTDFFKFNDKFSLLNFCMSPHTTKTHIFMTKCHRRSHNDTLFEIIYYEIISPYNNLTYVLKYNFVLDFFSQFCITNYLKDISNFLVVFHESIPSCQVLLFSRNT